MARLVYLDQNVLSDLRARCLKLPGNDQAKVMHELLKSSGQFRVVYSFTHLNEIRQILNPTFVDEHIDLLEELDARYIEPVDATISSEPVRSVWDRYQTTLADNVEAGLDKLTDPLGAFRRKQAGIPIAQSWEELNDLMRASLIEQGERVMAAVRELLAESLPGAPETLAMQQESEKWPSVKATIESIQFFPPGYGEDDIENFRELKEVKALKLHELDTHAVLPAIAHVFRAREEAPGFDLRGLRSREGIAICYTLMNWAGYFADDFRNTKKGRDRFKASDNDLSHAQQAICADFLISSDKAFVAKAKACYSFLEIPTAVMTQDEFLGAISSG